MMQNSKNLIDMGYNKILIDRVNVTPHRIEVYYSVEGEIIKYFNLEEKCFWVEYTEDVSSVPESIAVIPFVCNVLPIAWLADAELIVGDLDEEFYHSLFEVKHGYMLLSRMLEFKGQVTVKNIVKNRYVTTQQSAVLFSGGVDAFTTLFRHLDENPVMITLRGADVKLSDKAGWKVVSEHVEATAEIFDLPKPEFVTTNFRMFINEGTLSELVTRSGDGWWHGYQHGIGIISHAAPISYVKKLKVVCIASSATCKSLCIYASDPVIDSHLKFAETNVYHDGYFMNRLDKVKYLVDCCRQRKVSIHLRVCWITEGGHNCCKCEKCIRTIFNILAVGGDPKQMGFNILPENERDFERIVVSELHAPNIRIHWHDIQNYILSHQTFERHADSNYNWIYDLDVDKAFPRPSLLRKCLRRVKMSFKGIMNR